MHHYRIISVKRGYAVVQECYGVLAESAEEALRLYRDGDVVHQYTVVKEMDDYDEDLRITER